MANPTGPSAPDVTAALLAGRECLSDCCGNPTGDVGCREPGDLCGCCEAITLMVGHFELRTPTRTPPPRPSRR